ncbi:unnamed protein product [Timema podura]|uniref:Trehalase n=1 Tax=Timema podura TaxID=61482 RepID=A0ABN7NSL7_TIMPD|nr:unnamed protein product [Timema podura]
MECGHVMYKKYDATLIGSLGRSATNKSQIVNFVYWFQWIYTNYHAYAETKAMYEKYDATVAGAPGRGGEYENQIGFGWTNGYVMDLLFKYGDQLIPPPPTRFSKSQLQEEERTTESELEV